MAYHVKETITTYMETKKDKFLDKHENKGTLEVSDKVHKHGTEIPQTVALLRGARTLQHLL